MTIKIHPIPAFNDNYIWILHNNKQAVVVDPGDNTVVESYLSEHKLTLVAILITHHHYDHVDGLVALQNQWQCPVYAPNDERIPGKLEIVEAGDVVEIDSLKLKFNVLFTPGHTLTHICYHDDEKLFCGDTLFSLGCGRMFEGTAEQFSDSLNQLKQLPEDTKVYCTHEYTESNWRFANHVYPNNMRLIQFKTELDKKRTQGLPSLPSSIKIEKQINPFLNPNNSTILQSLNDQFGIEKRTEIENFALLRQWKDVF